MSPRKRDARQNPLDDLCNDPTVQEIFIYGPDHIVVTRGDKLERSTLSFDGVEHLRSVLEILAESHGLTFGPDNPIFEQRLENHWRLHAVSPPLAAGSPVATLRAPLPLLSERDLIDRETLTEDALVFLRSCIAARANILISGNHGGKTTLLNTLAGFIPISDRIITVEHVRELQLAHELVMSLEMKHRVGIEMRDLVRQAIHMGPDWLIVGELMSNEAADLVFDMSAGRQGVMSTINGGDPRKALARLETMMMWLDYPLRALRERVASGLNLIVHIDRMRDATRKVTRITEVEGMEGDVITTMDLFVFEQTGAEEGRILGKLKPTGLHPTRL